MLQVATVSGDTAAPVKVIVFTDFQCPYCRLFHAALTAARDKYPGAIATAVVHLPLSGHRHADAAARASECGAAAGRFSEIVDRLYEQQDSIGKVPWSSFAVAAGVEDTVRFANCMTDSSATRKVRLGMELAAKEGFDSTPTVIVNGWRYGVPPAETELLRAIGDILGGKQPYKGFARSDLASR